MPSQSAGATPLKNAKAATPAPSPMEKAPPHHHHHHHHHHAPRPGQQAAAATAAAAAAPQVKQPAPTAPTAMPPKPKTTISNKAVLEAVADRPRHHLGDFIYEPGLKPGRLVPNHGAHRGFSSNPKPLPWDVIKGKDNCILTVKVPRAHLVPLAREEITSRAFLWGTDVYTDDSDVVAACIHGGWIRGEWLEDVDASMLDLDEASRRKPKGQAGEAAGAAGAAGAGSEGLITSPPASGPVPVPADQIGRAHV